jgi:hypothetical protein
MVRALLRGVALCGAISAFACSPPPSDPLQLDRGMLTVDNRSASDWTNVEIWVNQYFRATAPVIAAHGRFQAPLNGFVSGYGQRFDFNHMQVRDVRLSAKTANGEPVDIKMKFEKGRLAGALGGKS